MTAERWRRAKTLFLAVVDFDAAHQERLLADLCGPDDHQLQNDVRELLASYRQHGFVDELATRLAAPSSAPATGAPVTRRIGRPEVIEQIGAGGMGVVYKAHDSQLDRFVAVKLISPERRLDNDWRQRLVVEARATAALDHPCIATIYEIGETDEVTLFLAMAFYEGETLASRLTRGALPIPEALRIAREIARGVAAAHTRGIVHRDLKPANVLLTPCRDRTGPDGGPTTKFSTGISASREGPHHARTARRLAITCLGVDEPGLLERVTGRPAVALEHLASASDRWRTVGNDWGLAFSLVEDAEAALDD